MRTADLRSYLRARLTRIARGVRLAWHLRSIGRARAALRKLGNALDSRDARVRVNAQNELRDIVDEALDLRRGPGGER